MEVVNETILIVEDNVGLNDLLSEKVQNCGYETYSVYSAVEAFEWLQGNKAFLILLDFSLPDMNGREFIELLMAEKCPLPPFIVATGQGDERIAVQMMKLGARDYVVKDSNFLELIPLIICKAVTEIKNEQKLLFVEKELAESSQFNKQIVEGAQEGIVVYDLDLNYLVWNPFMEKITGVRANAVLGKYILDVFPFLEKTEILENLKRALNGESGSEIEFSFTIPETGKSGWVLETYAPLRNTESQIIGAIAAVHDITERKLAEEKIEKIGQHYRALIEKAPDGIVLLNSDGSFKYISPSAKRMFGYDANDVVVGNPAEYTHPDDLEMVMTNLFRINEDPAFIPTLQYRFVDKKQNWKWVETTFSNLLADPNVESIVLNFRDITERKLAEMGLLESESRYHTLFNSSFEAILLTSPDGSIIAANPSACEMFMMKEDEITLKGRNGILDTTDPRLTLALKVRAKTGKFNGELTFIRANGEKFPCDISSSIFVDKDGNNRTSTIIRDVTERKKSEQALFDSEELYRNLVERLPDGVYKSTPEGKFVEVNPAIVKMLGYDNKEEMMAIDIKTDLYFDVADRESLIQNEFNQELDAYLLKKKDGSGVWVEDNGWYNTDNNGNVITHEGVLRDISERKKNEDALRESERKFSDLAVHSAGVIYQFYARKDGTTGFYYLSPKVNELFGFSNDLSSTDWNLGERVHPDDKEAFYRNVSEAIAEVKKFNFEGRVVTPSGIKWIHFLSSPIEKNDEVVFNGIMIDITERIAAEELLKESEAKYKELVENSPDAITIYIDGKIVFVNNACVGLIGAKSTAELIGQPVFEFVHPDSRSVVMARMKTIQTSGMVLDSQEEKFVRLDNKPVDVEVKAMSLTIQNKLAVQLIVRDITERKKIQNELIERKDLLGKLLFTTTELIDSSSIKLNYSQITDIAKEISGAKYVCFNIFDEDGLGFRTVAFSGLSDFQQKALDIFGFQIINKEWDYDPVREERIKDNTITEFDSLEILTGSLIPKYVLNKIQKTYKFGKIAVMKITKKNKIVGDFTILMKEGVDIKNKDILELFTNQVGLFIDRQISDEKLRKNEEKFRILFAENPQPMFVYNVETLDILEVNQTALNFYGYSKKEYLSMSVKELHPVEEIPVFLKTIEQTRSGIKTDGISHHIKKNGEKILVEIFTVTASFMGQNARHVLVVDVTERKEAEEKLKSSFSLLNATIESTADGILVVDMEGNANTFNKKFTEMWDIPQKLLIERSDENMLKYVLTQLSNPDAFLSGVTYLYKNPNQKSKDNIELKDGRVFERYSIPQKIDDKIVGRVWSFRDITERLVAENKLYQKIDEMTRFQQLTIGREHAMIALKKEINNLLVGFGEKEKYKIVE